jgi:beta-lactamase regulating signal transducer with metallopeptidase domain
MPVLDSAVRFIIAVLFDGLWEAALLAGAAALALRAMPNRNATTSHSVLVAALLAALILPVATACITTLHPAQSAAASTASAPSPERHVASGATTAGAALPPARIATGTPAAPAVESAPLFPRLNLSLPRTLALVLVAIWLAGSAFVLLRLIVSLWHLERLKRDALPVPVEYRSKLVRWTAAIKSSRAVRLCRSSDIVIPIAVGLFDAMILVPDRLLDELEPDDIDRIVLHELAHLRRADDWINAAERVASALLFFNPGIAWLVAQIDLEREVACDDWVLQQNDALPYATCLARVVETTVWPYRAMSAPGAFVTRRGMSVRIERLLTTHRDVRVRTSFGVTGIAIAVIGALCVAAAFVSPSIAYTVPAHVGATSVAPLPIHTVAAIVAGATSERSIEVVASSTAYIDELAAAGYTGLSIDQLMQLRALGVTADYIRQLADAGVVHPPVNELMQLRAIGVTGDYIRSMRARFGSATPVRDVEGLQALGVTAGYLDELSSAGIKDLSAERARQYRALGVSGAFVRDMGRVGYPNLTGDQLLKLRALGIDAAFVTRAAAHDFHNLTLDQLERLKISGILE